MLKTVTNCHVRNRGLQNYTEKVPFTLLLNYLYTFVFDIFSVLILFIYIVNIRYWQVLFVTQEQLRKSQSATSTFKSWGSSAAVLVSYDSFSIICAKILNILHVCKSLICAKRLWVKIKCAKIKLAQILSELRQLKCKKVLNFLDALHHLHEE